MNTAILIPAYEPDEKLIDLTYKLSTMQFPIIMVVNDGSSKKCDEIFDTLKKIPYCTVINHQFNKGKGAALKTGINAILNTDIHIAGCLTVDADGQHLPEDILKTAEVFERNSSALVLGCRDFSARNVPAKSRFGNLLTRAVYRLSTGKSLTDTQTGLRAIPVNLMKRFLVLPGDHYEFEMNMLMQAARNDIPIIETVIQTIYLEQNKASHFNPLLDSVRICKEILKFSFSSLVCSGVDIGLFTLAFQVFSSCNIPWPLLGATSFARLISSGINFTLNRKLVFQSQESLSTQGVKYYLLCFVQMLCSWLLLEGLTSLGPGNVVALKILADILLFVISFGVQRLFVFKRSMPHENNA